jgi:hypothetical protein
LQRRSAGDCPRPAAPQAAAGFDREAALAEARAILEGLGATAALERIMSRPGEHTAAIAAG